MRTRTASSGPLPAWSTTWFRRGVGLARAWYSDRLDLDWRRKTVAEAEAILTSLGLTSSFWSLRG